MEIGVEKQKKIVARSRYWRVRLVSVAAACLLAGCARVDPADDYRRAQELTARHTGSRETYDPNADTPAQRRVDALLAEGLTADEAVRIALLNNHEFQALFAQLGASRADVVQSGLFTNPTISFGAMLIESGGRSKLTFGLGQQIADLWQIPIRRKIAEDELERTLLDVVRRGVELSAEARQRYFEAVGLADEESIARNSADLLEQSLKLTKSQFDAGEVAISEVYLMRTQLLEAQRDLIVLGRMRRDAVIRLQRVLGIGRGGGDVSLIDPLPAVRPIESDAVLVAGALEQRAEAGAAYQKFESSRNEEIRQRLRLFPDVAVGLDFERPESKALPGRKLLADTVRESIANGGLTAPGIESRGQRAIEKSMIIDAMLGPNISLTLPLWDQNQAQIAKAHFGVLEQLKRLEDLYDGIDAEVRLASSAVRNAAELVQFYDAELLPQSDESMRVAKRAYQAGERSVLTLLDAERSWRSVARARSAVMREYALALVELERAMGGRLPPDSAAASQPLRSEARPTTGAAPE